MIVQKYLSGIRISDSLLYEAISSKKRRSWEPLHLQQGSLDGSCGLHAALMAAALCTGLPRDDLLRISSADATQFAEVWALAEKGYFAGVSATTVKRLAELLCPGVPVDLQTGKHRELFDATVAAVVADDIPLVLMGDTERANAHWLLVNGVEFEVDGTPVGHAETPTALLGLDSDSLPPRLAASNWRMRRERDKASRVTCESLSGPDSYRGLQRLVVLRRSELAERPKPLRPK